MPLIDRLGQQGWEQGKLLTWEPENGRVAASQPRYRDDAEAERELQIDGDRLIDTVRLKATDGKGHLLGLLVQLQGKARFPAESVAVPDFAESPAAPGFEHFKNVRRISKSFR